MCFVFGLMAILCLGSCRQPPKLEDYTYLYQEGPLSDITLNFDSETGQYYGRAVNRYFGRYKTAGDKLKLATPASTMIMASEEKMQAEEIYLNRLEQVMSYRLTDQYLTLILTDGGHLTLTTQPKN